MPRPDLLWRIWAWTSIVWLMFAYFAIRPTMELYGLDVFTGSQLDDVPAHVAKLRADTAPKCFAPSISVTYASKIGNPFSEFDTDGSSRLGPRPQTTPNPQAAAATGAGDQTGAAASVPYTVASVVCITKGQAVSAVLGTFLPPLILLGVVLVLIRRWNETRRRRR